MSNGEATSKAPEGKDGPFPKSLKPNFIKFNTLYQGPKGPTDAAYVVAHSTDDVRKVIDNPEALGIDLSTIDFGLEEIVIVGLGERPTSAYGVTIDSIIYLTDRGPGYPDETDVVYKETKKDGPSLDVLTFPVHIVRLETLAGRTQFTAEPVKP